MPCGTLIRHRIGDSPIEQFAHRIVTSRQTPSRSLPIRQWCAGPCLVAGLAGSGRCIEPPGFFAGERIVSRDVTICAIASAGAARYEFAFDHDAAGTVAPRVDLAFPTHLAGARIDSDDIAVWSGVEDDVLIHR